MWLTSRCQRKDELFRECKILFIFWLLRPDFFKGQNIEMSGHWIAKLYKFGQIYYKTRDVCKYTQQSSFLKGVGRICNGWIDKTGRSQHSKKSKISKKMLNKERADQLKHFTNQIIES